MAGVAGARRCGGSQSIPPPPVNIAGNIALIGQRAAPRPRPTSVLEQVTVLGSIEGEAGGARCAERSNAMRALRRSAERAAKFSH